MRKAILLALAISAVGVVPLRAEDACCENKSATVEAKLREIDLSVLLMKYEQLTTECAKVDVQLILMEAVSTDHAKEYAALETRLKSLKTHIKDLREEIKKLADTDTSVAAK